MKKIAAAVTVMLMSVSLCACHVSTHSYTTSTTTVTTTDAAGNVSTTTTVTTKGNFPEGSCGAAAQDGEKHTVDISIENATGSDITGLYVCRNGSDSWSNLFDEGEVLADGDTDRDYLTITYTSENPLRYDFGIKDADGVMHEFDDIDISDVSADGFAITFGNTGDGYNCNIPSSYIM